MIKAGCFEDRKGPIGHQRALLSCRPVHRMYLEVECPDASRVSVDGRRVFGRRHLGAAADDSISREQFRIDPVDGVPDVAQLHVLGRNGNAQSVITPRALRRSGIRTKMNA